MPRSRVKNRSDTRYKNNEIKIRKATSELLARKTFRIRVREICRKSDIKLPTFYWHYHNVDDIISNMANQTLEEFRQTLPIDQTYKIPDILRNWLVFIVQRRHYFYALEQRSETDLFQRMSNELRPFLTKSWPTYGKTSDSRLYQVYSAELISAIFSWGESSKFSPSQLENCLKTVLSLSHDPVKRLKIIVS